MDQALPHVAECFGALSKEERDYAEKLLSYQNQRGGQIVYKGIAKPSTDTHGSLLDAFATALDLEKVMNQVRYTIYSRVLF